MAIHYSSTTIGTLTLAQPIRATNRQTGKYELVKDGNGRQVYNKYEIQIRKSNCLMCAIHVYKVDEPEDPTKPYRHDLVMFFSDEQHLKNCKKTHRKDLFKSLFCGELKNIKLNIYHKECQTLLKYMVRDGLKVQCYYKEDKK